MSTDRIWRQYLQHLNRNGVTHVPTVQFPERVPPERRSAQPSPAATRRPSSPVVRSSGGPLKSPTELQPESVQLPAMLDMTSKILDGPLKTLEEKSDALCQLAETVGGCRRCTELADTRTQTVFGVGNPDARIMFIGEAPGADEDRQGEPFVGRAGKLLNKIIEACKIKREEIYICNILRCRPPGNRNPQPQEAANCREFLDAQIRVVNPDYIVCWGTVAAQNLLKEKRTIGKLRHVFHQYNDAKVLCTYHPSYLLRNPSAKKDVWDDMKILMKDLGVELE
jgi:uracil-DNA glycosylase family 4